MLDDDQRVAEVAQPQQRLEQPVVSRWCSPIDGSSSTYSTPDQPGADLRGRSAAPRHRPAWPTPGPATGNPDPYPAGTAGVRRSRSAPGPRWSCRVRTARAPAGTGPGGNRQRAEVRDGPAVHRHRERDRVQPCPTTGRARHLAHEPAEPCLVLAFARFRSTKSRPRSGRRRSAADQFRVVYWTCTGWPCPCSRACGRRGQLGPRRVDGEPERPAESLGQPYKVVAGVSAAPRRDRALFKRLGLVGHDQLRIHLELGAQAGAVPGTRPTAS